MVKEFYFGEQDVNGYKSLRFKVKSSLCLFSPSPNVAASVKKKNKKGKTISLTDFLAEGGGIGGGSTYFPKPVSWVDETDDLEGDVSTTWHSNDDDVYLPSRFSRV